MCLSEVLCFLLSLVNTFVAEGFLQLTLLKTQMPLVKITFMITFEKTAVAGAKARILVGRADIKKGPPNHPYRIKLVKKSRFC